MSVCNLTIFIACSPTEQDYVTAIQGLLKEAERKLTGAALQVIWYDGALEDSPLKADFRPYLTYADLVLLVVSKTFITSPFYISEDMQETLRRHQAGKAQVCLFIARPCWWEDTRLAKFPVLPLSGIAMDDAGDTAPKIWQQVAGLLEERLSGLLEKKSAEEQLFYNTVKEAAQLFADWQSDPDDLPRIRELYERALALYQSGFQPDMDTLRLRAEICTREIDFRYYASAAENAFKAKDFNGTLYHAKDALALRDDARMRRLMQMAEAEMDATRKQQKRTPFNAHIQTADHFFLLLDFDHAIAEYEAALPFYEAGFEPSRDLVERKINLCVREKQATAYIARAEAAIREYDYEQALDHLENALRGEHPRIIQLVRRLSELIASERHLQRFQDKDNELWGFFDDRNDIVVVPPRYEDAYHFSDHLAAVKKGGLWGFIDVEGNVVIPFAYDFVSHFERGVSEVYREGKKFQITRMAL